MSKTNQNYSLKIPENFASNDKIIWLDEQENGARYIWLYIRMCLMTLNASPPGRLVRQVGKMTIEFDYKTIAARCNTQIDTVAIAIEAMRSCDLLQITENGGIYLPEVVGMLEKVSDWAIEKREYRARMKSGHSPKIVQKQIGRCPDTPSSSSYLKQNNDKTTTTEKSNYDETKIIIPELLATEGISRNDINRLEKKGVLTDEEIQNSLYDFAFDLTNIGFKKKIKSTPKNYFMAILEKSNTSYKSLLKFKKEQTKKLQNEARETEKLQTDFLNEKIENSLNPIQISPDIEMIFSRIKKKNH